MLEVQFTTDGLKPPVRAFVVSELLTLRPICPAGRFGLKLLEGYNGEVVESQSHEKDALHSCL